MPPSDIPSSAPTDNSDGSGDPPARPRLIVREPSRVVFDLDDPYWADGPILTVVDAGDGTAVPAVERGHIDPVLIAHWGRANGPGWVIGERLGYLVNPDFPQYATLTHAGVGMRMASPGPSRHCIAR